MQGVDQFWGSFIPKEINKTSLTFSSSSQLLLFSSSSSSSENSASKALAILSFTLDAVPGSFLLPGNLIVPLLLVQQFCLYYFLVNVTTIKWYHVYSHYIISPRSSDISSPSLRRHSNVIFTCTKPWHSIFPLSLRLCALKIYIHLSKRLGLARLGSRFLPFRIYLGVVSRFSLSCK